MVDEIAFAKLVFDELVGGAGVRHAQQGLGEHHQRQALLGRECEFAQHVFDAAKPVIARADGIDQAGGGMVDPRVLFGAQASGFQQCRRDRTIVRRVGRTERRKGCGSRRHGYSRSKPIMPPVVAELKFLAGCRPSTSETKYGGLGTAKSPR